MKAFAILGLIMAGGIGQTTGQIPTDAFHVKVTASRRPVKAILTTPFQRTFRTRIRREANLAADFAGHFRIVEWGCGSSCVSIAVIKKQTGEVSDGPFKILGYGARLNYEGVDDELEYRASSSLLIARGARKTRTVALTTTNGRRPTSSRFALLPRQTWCVGWPS
jgi:hypothetical protein